MTCTEFTDALADYLERTLDAAKSQAAEQHMEQCPECREQVALWQRLASLPVERPSPALRAGFDAMLESFGRGEWNEEAEASSEHRRRRPGLARPWMQPLFAPWMQTAASLVLLAAGFLVGRQTRSTDHSMENDQLASLHKELNDTKELVALSMLQQQSANDRLQGVSWSTRAGRPAPEVLSALLHALEFDSCVDVRLAALDALKRYQERPEIRQGMASAFQKQQSPLVQVALIDFFVDLHDTDAVRALHDFQQKQDLNPSVRERLEHGIQQSNRG